MEYKIISNGGSLEGLHDTVANVTGPVSSDVRPWSGDFDSAVSTYFSLREYQLGGSESVFMIDYDALRSAREFICKHCTEDEFRLMENDWFERLSLKK